MLWKHFRQLAADFCSKFGHSYSDMFTQCRSSWQWRKLTWDFTTPWPSDIGWLKMQYSSPFLLCTFGCYGNSHSSHPQLHIWRVLLPLAYSMHTLPSEASAPWSAHLKRLLPPSPLQQATRILNYNVFSGLAVCSSCLDCSSVSWCPPSRVPSFRARLVTLMGNSQANKCFLLIPNSFLTSYSN